MHIPLLKFWESYSMHMPLPTHRQSENASPAIAAYFWIWGGTCTRWVWELFSCQPKCKSFTALSIERIFYVWSRKEMDYSKAIGLTAFTNHHPPPLTFIDLLAFVYFCNSDMAKGRPIISLSIYEFFVVNCSFLLIKTSTVQFLHFYNF